MQPCSLTGHPSSADRLLGSGEKPRDNKEIFSNVDGAITDYADYRAVASSLAQDTQEFLFSKGSHKKFRLQNLSNIKNMLPRRKDGRSAKYKKTPSLPIATNPPPLMIWLQILNAFPFRVKLCFDNLVSSNSAH